ncbi:MAG: signal recognition particle-docking protein FtsY [Arenicella sp.]
MALFFRKKKKPVDEAATTQALNKAETHDSTIPANSTNNQEQDDSKQLNQGLEKSRSSILSGISSLFSSGVTFDDDIYDELEDTLLSCDIGVEASQHLIESLRDRVKTDRVKTQADVIKCLQDETSKLLSSAQRPWNFNLKPYVILMVGVNGVGKTTTTAKIAHYFQRQGKKVVLAAGDTFRAAAIEQLQEWGQRLNIPVISQSHGADSAAVAHDAFSAALARDADVLIIDTAGRLHTQSNLMEQLEKVKRVLKKIDADTPHEVMQVLDATTGQNAMSQLKHFRDSVGVNSICLTKLDGSAKGGVALGLTQAFQLPIRFIGVGEAFEDLQAFDAPKFSTALIPDDTVTAKNS